jgi:hypothetical protein
VKGGGRWWRNSQGREGARHSQREERREGRSDVVEREDADRGRWCRAYTPGTHARKEEW